MNHLRFWVTFCFILPIQAVFVALLDDIGYGPFWYWAFRLSGGAVGVLICLLISLTGKAKRRNER